MRYAERGVAGYIPVVIMVVLISLFLLYAAEFRARILEEEAKLRSEAEASFENLYLRRDGDELVVENRWGSLTRVIAIVELGRGSILVKRVSYLVQPGGSLRLHLEAERVCLVTENMNLFCLHPATVPSTGSDAGNSSVLSLARSALAPYMILGFAPSASALYSFVLDPVPGSLKDAELGLANYVPTHRIEIRNLSPEPTVIQLLNTELRVWWNGTDLGLEMVYYTDSAPSFWIDTERLLEFEQVYRYRGHYTLCLYIPTLVDVEELDRFSTKLLFRISAKIAEDTGTGAQQSVFLSIKPFVYVVDPLKLYLSGWGIVAKRSGLDPVPLAPSLDALLWIEKGAVRLSLERVDRWRSALVYLGVEGSEIARSLPRDVRLAAVLLGIRIGIDYTLNLVGPGYLYSAPEKVRFLAMYLRVYNVSSPIEITVPEQLLGKPLLIALPRDIPLEMLRIVSSGELQPFAKPINAYSSYWELILLNASSATYTLYLEPQSSSSIPPSSVDLGAEPCASCSASIESYGSLSVSDIENSSIIQLILGRNSVEVYRACRYRIEVWIKGRGSLYVYPVDEPLLVSVDDSEMQYLSLASEISMEVGGVVYEMDIYGDTLRIWVTKVQSDGYGMHTIDIRVCEELIPIAVRSYSSTKVLYLGAEPALGLAVVEIPALDLANPIG